MTEAIRVPDFRTKGTDCAEWAMLKPCCIVLLEPRFGGFLISQVSEEVIEYRVAKLFSYTWSMGFFLCKGVHYLQNVSAICSVLTLTAMSIERYYAIVHPMKAKYMCTISQARKIILGIWVASFLLAVPNLVSQEHILVGIKYKAYYCVQTMDKPSLWRFHEVYMLLLILVIPTCIMIVAYGSISWEIWHVMQRRYDMTSGQALNPVGGRGGVESFPLRYSKRFQRGMGSNVGSFRESIRKANAIRTEEENNTVKQVTGAHPFGSRIPGLQNHLHQQKTHQVIKMLVAVVALFVLCWAPLLILNVLYAYGVVSKYSNDVEIKNVQSGFTVMAYSNSCINPLVYGFMSKNFRESFYKALCRCCYRGGRVPKRHFSLSQTRTTSVRFKFHLLVVIVRSIQCHCRINRRRKDSASDAVCQSPRRHTDAGGAAGAGAGVAANDRRGHHRLRSNTGAATAQPAKCKNFLKISCQPQSTTQGTAGIT
ncbi:pyroglutamylated RF-amide peptide receptor [Cryptotermes secundus]|uniref:pyroglutamylated RF-amide peptide receptor n=1 Tax=Cryptotermes secundus TaxID=105785 RepID=UPI001454C757|nr:pyroglutamylated RF-amide peptide receptor [Cryptotermes secundus]